MIATITLNPCMDEHITVNGLVVEEANRWSKLRRYAGGKGIDVSRAIHEMDGRTIAYGFIGGPEGRALEILLDEEGVQFSFTPIDISSRGKVLCPTCRGVLKVEDVFNNWLHSLCLQRLQLIMCEKQLCLSTCKTVEFLNGTDLCIISFA